MVPDPHEHQVNSIVLQKATKMARKRQLTIEERQTIITLKNVGLSYREIAKKVKVSVSTVFFTVKRHSETGGNSDRKRSGRPKATTESEDKFLRVNSLRDRRLTGQQLQAQLNSGHSTQVSVSTVKRRLRAAGLTGRVAARKPLLRRQNKTKRLAWAMKHRHWTTEDWKKVLWTDESKFQIFGSSRRIFVRRRVGERMVPQCVTSTVKHGGGSVMVWGCFAGSRVGDLYRVRGTLNQNGYHSILQRHAIPSGMRLIGQRFILQQDNDPKHKSKLCQTYLRKKEQDGKLENMEWPAQSPDLNPIELVWDELDRRVKAKQPTSATHLWELLQQSWEELSEEYLISIVERMPRVCAAVISAKGGYFDESKV